MAGHGRTLRPLVVGLLLAALPALAAPAGTRVALLIGNSDYLSDPLDLKNPVNDARALGDALGALGFEVTVLTDADAPRMRTAVAGFGARARGAEMALFFFAGHGVRFAGDNMLVGTGFASADPAGLRSASVAMHEVKRALEGAAPGAGLILLDACRDAPIRDDGIAPGLVRTGGGAGLLVAYATDPGNLAYDGEGENSVFTRALLDHLATPGLDVRLMLGRVRQQVVLDTFGQQVPWVEEALIGEHDVAPGAAEAAEDAGVAELRLWRDAAEGGDASALRGYLDAYPDGAFSAVARERLAQRAAGAAGRSAGPVWRAEDPDRLAAALAALGYVSGSGGAAGAEAALSAWLAASPGTPAPATLYSEATQALTALAGATAQRLRTDLVALRSVDRLLRVSKSALAEIERLAQSNPDAGPVLAQARHDVEAIERSRHVILLRLDQSRSYYAELLALAARFVPGTRTDGAPAPAAPGIDERLRADAALFLKHVAAEDPATEGSYSWLADFLRQG